MSLAAPNQVRLVHEPINPSIGSRVLNSKQELLSGTIAGAIRDLLEQRGVVVFPEIHFTDDEQVAFTKTLGTFQPERQGGDVVKVTLDTKENPYSAEYLKGSLYWHLDGTMNDVPILASLLASKKLASWGGNTGKAGDLVMWDNTGTMHRAEAYDPKSGRLLHRTKLEGEESFV